MNPRASVKGVNFTLDDSISNLSVSEKSIKHIVLIDDEPGVLRALKLVLTALQFSIIDFVKPEEALSYLASGKPCNLVLSDLRMPEMDGIALLEKIRAANNPIPFILISGHATEEDIARAYAAGANGFLAKPFGPEELQAAIKGL